MKMESITAQRALSPAEAMGIKIGPTVVKMDAYLWNLNPHPMWDLSRVIYRKNRVTCSAGDAQWNCPARHFVEAELGEDIKREAA